MATFLDVGLIQNFSAIFPVLLVFAIMWALLQKTKVLGNSPAINALISAVTGLSLLLSKNAIDIINFMIPWITVAIIFFVLVILIFQTFGVKEEAWSTIIADKSVYWSILGVLLLIMIAAIGSVLGQSIGPYLDEINEDGTTVDGVSNVATGNFQQNVFATLFHPKVLGLLIVFTIMIFAVALLSGD